MPGLRREVSGGVVRHVDLFGREGVVLYSELTAETADAAIDEQVAFFRAQRQDFEWKVFAHDQPPDLVERLSARGLEIDQREAVMVRDLESSPPTAASQDSVLIRRALTRDDLRNVVAVKGNLAALDTLTFELETDPDYLSVYVAYAGDAPVSTGWIRFPSNSAFASLWGGATLPEYRNRGVYTALVLARLAEAEQRGYRFAYVDAGPMSRPILEKREFSALTYATACTWHV